MTALSIPVVRVVTTACVEANLQWSNTVVVQILPKLLAVDGGLSVEVEHRSMQEGPAWVLLEL